VAVKLFLLPFQDSLPTELLVLLESCALALLIAVASWRASSRSQSYARALWRCVAVAALLWAVNFGVGVFAFIHARAPSPGNTPIAAWVVMVINSRCPSRRDTGSQRHCQCPAAGPDVRIDDRTSRWGPMLIFARDEPGALRAMARNGCGDGSG